MSYMCESTNTAYIAPEVWLSAVVGKWVLFFGDSSTRAMAQVLINQFDSDQTHPINFQKWYNSSSSLSYWDQKNWRRAGGDARVIDYIVSVVGRPKIIYENASMIIDPSVLSHRHPLSDTGTVRLTFYDIRNTGEMASSWKTIVKDSTPDFTYLNVGAFNGACDLDVIRRIVSQSHVIWGTQQLKTASKCDARVIAAFPTTGVLDRTLLPNTKIGQLHQLRGVHYAHLVNLYDVMHLIQRFAGLEPRHAKILFHRWCSIHEKADLNGLRPPLPPPSQGWKTPWKLPCLARAMR